MKEKIAVPAVGLKELSWVGLGFRVWGLGFRDGDATSPITARARPEC